MGLKNEFFGCSLHPLAVSKAFSTLPRYSFACPVLQRPQWKKALHPQTEMGDSPNEMQWLPNPLARLETASSRSENAMPQS